MMNLKLLTLEYQGMQLLSKRHKNIFPRSVRNQIEDVHQDGTVKRLSLENQQKAEFYFNK